jgi:hypothetical protein
LYTKKDDVIFFTAPKVTRARNWSKNNDFLAPLFFNPNPDLIPGSIPARQQFSVSG